MSTLRGAVLLALATAAMPSLAADVSYLLNGSAPYYWSTEGNWSGNALPGADDAAIISQSGLNTSPLIVEADTSLSVSNIFLETGMMVVEPGASLTVKKGNSGFFSIGRLANVTAVLTNYGSIAAYNFDLGNNAVARKGTLSRFDNFGDLTIDWRLGMGWGGTPCIFYNHEGATVTKNRTGSTYTFYFCYAGGNSTLINDGTFTDLTASHIRVGMSSSGKAAIILNKSGTFTSNGTVGLGYGDTNNGNASTANGSLTQNDSSRSEFTGSVCLGYGKFAVGTVTLNDSSTFESKGGSVYVGYGTNGKGYFTLSNESAFVSSVPVILGNGSSSYGSMVFADNSAGSFGSDCRIGYGGAKSFGSLAISDNASVTFNGLCGVGISVGGVGEMHLADSARVETRNQLYVCANEKGCSTGLVTLAGSSILTNISGAAVIGCYSNSCGRMEISDDARFVSKNNVYLGHGNGTSSEGAQGFLTLADNASAEFSGNYMYIGGQKGATGTMELRDSSVLGVSNLIAIGTAQYSTGLVTVVGSGRLFCSTNITMATATDSSATMTVTNSGFVKSRFLQLAPGARGLAHLKVADQGMLVASNIAVAVNETASTGILEIAEGAIVSNDYIKIGCNSTTSRGILKMSGGTLFISGKDPYDPIYLNQRRLDVSAWIRGWGKVAFADPRASVTEWSGSVRTRCIVHYGQVIADGEGVERDLDFGRFNSLSYANTAANPSGTNGWFAVNKGRLKLPRCLPRKTADYRCSGDCYDLNYANESSTASTSNRLANTFTCVFQGAALNNFVFSELYAPDRSDIPAGLDALDVDRTISVWRIGLFSDGPEIDEPVSPDTFASAKIHFRFPNDNLEGLAVMCVYRHDGTANGKWQLVGHAKVRKGWPVVPARVLAPSDANWNLGWFAVVGRVNPFGNTLIVR